MAEESPHDPDGPIWPSIVGAIALMLLVAVGWIALTRWAAAADYPLCPPPPEKRHDCVHDGDTVWSGGVKYRLAVIDAPELFPLAKCPAEHAAAMKARARMAELLGPGFTVEPTGAIDKDHRPLAHLRLADGRDAGGVLLAEGLAERWRQVPAKDWCATR